MNWYQNLYLSKKAKKKKQQLIQMIESGKTPVSTYLLMVPTGRQNQLEILPAIDLKFWNEEKECSLIIGISCSKSEAFELVHQITEDVLQKTGDVKLREYFERG